MCRVPVDRSTQTKLTGDKMKYRRTKQNSISGLKFGWMFPLLAVFSLFLNGSIHLKRNHAYGDYGSPRPPSLRVLQVSASPRRTANNDTRQPATSTKATTTTSSNVKGGMTSSGNHRTAGTKTKRNKRMQVSKPRLTKPQQEPTKNQLVTDPKSQTTMEKKQEVKEDAKTSTTTKDEFFGKDPLTAGVTPTAVSPNITSAACLLIRDDNDILNEWIAYHYHVLRMRRLIVAVDPLSETSPKEVLDKWEDHMEIDLWTDDMYMPKAFLKTGKPPKEHIENITKFPDITYDEMTEINSHRYRQKYFLTRCLAKVKDEGRTWAMHIDTDEYVVANKLLRQMQAKYVDLKPVEQPGSVLDMVQQVVKDNASNVAYPCISILRVLFGSVESTEVEWPKDLPSDFNKTTFETLRWRHHGLIDDRKLHGHPKVLLDVSKIPKKYFQENEIVYSIHRPFRNFCRSHGESDITAFEKYPITANHYLGSWERYNARDDKRRSWQIYNEKATVNNGQDDWARGWLQGFVEDVGMDKAKHLLGRQYLANNVAIAKS